MIVKGVSGHPDENPTQLVLVSFPSETCKQIPEQSKTLNTFKFKFLYGAGRYSWLCFLLLFITGFSSSASADDHFEKIQARMNQVSEQILMLNQPSMKNNTQSSQEYKYISKGQYTIDDRIVQLIPCLFTQRILIICFKP